MKEMRATWESPHIEILPFEEKDVICTSGMVTKDSGFGDQATWDDLFSTDHTET